MGSPARRATLTAGGRDVARIERNLALDFILPDVPTIPTTEREFWILWAELAAPNVRLSPSQRDVKREMGPLVTARLRPPKRRAGTVWRGRR